MALLYGRKIVVDIAGLTITGPRISLELSRQIDRSQDKGSVEIFNLSPEHAGRIEERGERIIVQAGYKDRAAIIFQGEVQRVIRKRERLSHITAIALGDLVRDRKVLSGTYNRSWVGPASVREIAVDIISEGFGLLAGPLEAIPEEATFTNFYWAGSPAVAALDALLGSVGATWFERDGVVRVNRPGFCQTDAPILDVSPETGMIESPIRTDEGAEVRVFLEPRAVLGGAVEIRGSDTGIAGKWKIVGLAHKGDNWQGKFETFLDLREIDG